MLDSDTVSMIYQKRWKVEEFRKLLKSNVALSKSPAKTIKSQVNYVFMEIYSFVPIKWLLWNYRA